MRSLLNLLEIPENLLGASLKPFVKRSIMKTEGFVRGFWEGLSDELLKGIPILHIPGITPEGISFEF